jgi:hypothetical protein
MTDFADINDELHLEDALASEAESRDELPVVRRISARSSDPTLKDLYDRYCEGDLILQPDFQRYFVWDDKKSSRLIESVLLDLPLPIIFLAEEAGGRESVVDGQQRLTALFTFLDGKWALSSLELHPELNGVHFADLPRQLRLKIRRAPIRVTTILKESDEELKFEIFERLNTGSVALNDQELRNCIYRGGYNNLLKKMAADGDFLYLLGLTQPERRMRDVELVLRFAAFYHAGDSAYRAPMRRFLNEEMAHFRHITNEEAVEMYHAFRDAVQTLREMMGQQAGRRFRRGHEQDPNGAWEARRFNAALFDVLLGGFTRYPRREAQPHLGTLREALLWLLTEDEEFIASCEASTSSKRMVSTRFDKWLGVLRQVVGESRRPSSVRRHKEEILRRTQECCICGQDIKQLDDAAILGLDRFLPDESELAQELRLAHRFCKWNQVRQVRGAGGGF